MKRISLLNLCAVLLVTSARAAESAVPQQIPLDALVADVLENNPELNFYRAEIAAASAH